MGAAKKKKTKRPSGASASRKKTSSASRKRDKRSAGKPTGEETFVKKYYPVFENLVLFLLGMGTYWEALRKYLKEEIGYRTGRALQGFAFFVVGVVFLAGSVVFLILAFFFLLQWLTGSNALAAFAIFLIALALAVLFFYITLVRFQNVVEPRHEKQADDFDDL